MGVEFFIVSDEAIATPKNTAKKTVDSNVSDSA